MGRPRKLTDERVSELLGLLEEYIRDTDIPILAEFAYQNNIDRATLYDYDEFSTLRKALIAKKEAQLERMGLAGEVDRTMAVFSLKQLGWSDKQQLQHTGAGGGPVDVQVRFVEAGDDG